MNRQDTHRQAAELHLRNLDQGFLSSLGVRFLTQMYRAIDESSEAVLLCASRDGRVVGFISGATGMGPIFHCMLRRPWPVAWALLPSLFRPRQLLKIVEIFRYGRTHEIRLGLPMNELLSIVVDPQFRGQGIAEALYRRLVEHFSAAGVVRFKIVVGNALSPAHRFYRRMGAVPVAEVEVHSGQRSTVFVHSFGPKADGK